MINIDFFCSLEEEELPSMGQIGLEIYYPTKGLRTMLAEESLLRLLRAMSCLESVDRLMSLLPEVRVLSLDLKTLIESRQEEVVPSMNTKVDHTATVLTNNKLLTIHLLENYPSQ